MRSKILTLSALFLLLLQVGCSDNNDKTIQEEEDYPRPQREMPGVSR